MPKQQDAFADAIQATRLCRTAVTASSLDAQDFAEVVQVYCAMIQVRALDRLTAALEAHTEAVQLVGVIDHTEDGTTIVRHAPSNRHN